MALQQVPCRDVPGDGSVSDGRFVRSDVSLSVNLLLPCAPCFAQAPNRPHMWLDTLFSIVSILVPSPIIAPADLEQAFASDGAVAALEQRTIFLNSIMTHSEVNNSRC